MNSKILATVGVIGAITTTFFSSIPIIEVRTIIGNKHVVKDYCRPQYVFYSKKKIGLECKRDYLGMKNYIQKEFFKNEEEDPFVKVYCWTRSYKWFLNYRHEYGIIL